MRIPSDKWTPMETFDFSCIKTMVIIIDCESSKFFCSIFKVPLPKIKSKKKLWNSFHAPHLTMLKKFITTNSSGYLCPSACWFVNFDANTFCHHLQLHFWGFTPYSDALLRIHIVYWYWLLLIYFLFLGWMLKEFRRKVWQTTSINFDQTQCTFKLRFMCKL